MRYSPRFPSSLACLIIVMVWSGFAPPRLVAAQEGSPANGAANESSDSTGPGEQASSLAQGRAAATATEESEELPPPLPQPSPTEEPSSSSATSPAPPPERSRGEIGIRLLDTNKGVIVRGVIVGAAGDKAGIQPGDRIVTVDGVPVKTMAEVRDLVTPKFAGERCVVEIERNGQTERLACVLEPHVGYYDASRSGSSQGTRAQPSYDRRATAYDRPRSTYAPSYRTRPSQPYRSYTSRYPRAYGNYGGYYGPGFGVPYGGFYGPRYGRYYGTSRFGYRDFGYGRGGVRIGNFSVFW